MQFFVIQDILTHCWEAAGKQASMSCRTIDKAVSCVVSVVVP